MGRLSAKQYLYLFVILLVLIITAQNIAPVQLNFFNYQFQLPLIVLLGFVFFLGFFSAIIFVKPPKKNDEIQNEKKKKAGRQINVDDVLIHKEG